jgi:ABC-type Mn2+/Zn2+ transport system permease subunit
MMIGIPVLGSFAVVRIMTMVGTALAKDFLTGSGFATKGFGCYVPIQPPGIEAAVLT